MWKVGREVGSWKLLVFRDERHFWYALRLNSVIPSILGTIFAGLPNPHPRIFGTIFAQYL